MTYDRAVAQLLELGHELHQTPSAKFDLAHMRVLLAALGHPERRFPAVLIAGTNGKGSTAATLAAILRAAGYRTALYTSPHLLKVNERLQVDGAPIGDPEFAALHQRVERVAAELVEKGELPWHPSFFEMLTAMAFDYFAESAVDIAVLEVGMGGRLDATNVVEPAIAIITDIALDHQKFLGNTLREIAGEKAGIIRPGATVVTLPQHPEANDVLGNTILERGARAVSAVPYVPPVSPGASPSDCHPERGEGSAVADDQRPTANDSFRNQYPLEVLGEIIQVDSPLAGRHQLRNLALAIAASVELNQCGFSISARQIEQGIRETRWPGRFQLFNWKLGTGNRQLILDVAHNPAGAWALRSTLSACCGERPLTFVFGAMRDKDIAEIAEILFPLAARILATRAHNPRSASPDEIREAAPRFAAEILSEPDVPAALARARSLAAPDGIVVVTGSIYVVGEALAVLDGD
jgi:dihydrofolate synthase/folylpolyglutamate synthase